MDNKPLTNLLFAFICLVVGISLLSITSDSVYEATELSTPFNESVTITVTTNSVVNESITTSSGLGALPVHSILSVTFFGNGTISTDTTGVDVDEEVNWTRGGVVTVNADNFTDATWNISYTYSTDAAGTIANDDIESVSYFGNTTMSTDITGIDLTDEVNWTANGSIRIADDNFTAGTGWLISYQYQGDEYVDHSQSRVFIRLITLFFAIAVLACGILLAYDSFKKIAAELG